MAVPAAIRLPEGLVELPALPAGARLRRRRALLRGEGGLPDRPVLVEWIGGAEAPGAVARARARRGLCHVHLARVLRAGLLHGEAAPLGYVVSEQPTGVDLLTVVRAARAQGGAPPWFFAAVLHAAGRGVLALHRHLAPRGGAARHGALHPANIFVGQKGEVQVLAFSALPSEAPDGGGPRAEERAAAWALGPEADVHALCRLLAELLPEAAVEAPLAPLVGAGLADPRSRPSLEALLLGLGVYLLREAPLQRRAAVGAILVQLCPRGSADQGGGDLGDLGALDLLGAWEDLFGPGGSAPAEAAAPPRPAARARAWDLLLLGGAALLLGAGVYYLAGALLG